ncbi:hypothetical protein GXB81_15190 [Paraburkholderia sp. Ac-20336]|uniref:hypothetical protein n=1 Tax=Burkholderiaceae TaxID=119060 RepID=UPI0014227103|nr:MULTISPECIES: hypothetical protein [Burkholderiaceae]MBN3804384.1 hypothetical protein [Paraburkholderia sp. Ac-20336]MBN3847181.1 hypothetical protein [Paraburkholderia sp. Ac-20342]NIF50606.1 hypothetical protein [Burkholderia sp. Ax-1724]
MRRGVAETSACATYRACRVDLAAAIITYLPVSINKHAMSIEHKPQRGYATDIGKNFASATFFVARLCRQSSRMKTGRELTVYG